MLAESLSSSAEGVGRLYFENIRGWVKPLQVPLYGLLRSPSHTCTFALSL
jgi:hypothetical protein